MYVMDVESFRLLFMLLDVSKFPTIMNRPDINTLLGKLHRENVLAANLVNTRRDLTKDLYPDLLF